MTIDEAITTEIEYSQPCDIICKDGADCNDCRSYHRQLAEWFMHKHEQNCPDGEYQIRFPGIPYVLTMKKEEKGGTDAEH